MLVTDPARVAGFLFVEGPVGVCVYEAHTFR